MAEDAGELSLNVVADLRGFAKRLRADIERAAANVKIRVPVEVDSVGLRKRLREVVDKAGAGITFSPGVTVDSTGLRSRLRDAVTTASARQKATVGVDVDSTGLRRRLRDITATSSRGVNAKIGVDLDAKTLPAKTRTTKDEAQRAAGKIKIPVELDVGKSGRQLTGLVKLLKFPAIVAAIGPLVGLVSSLGAGLVALTGALSPVVALAAAAPAGLAALGQGFAAVKLATSGMGDAFKQVAAAQTKLRAGQKLTTAEADKLRASLNGLSPSARRFVVQITQARPALDALRRGVQERFFAPFVETIGGLATRLLPTLRARLQDTAQVLGRVVAQLANMAASPVFRGQLNRILTSNNRALATLTGAVPALTRGFFALLDAAGPLLNALAGSAARLIRMASASIVAGAASGRLAAFLERARKVGGQLVAILVNLARGLFGVGRAGVPVGQTLLTLLQRLTRTFADLTNSAAGQSALRRWFQDALPAIIESGKLVGALARAIAGLSNDAALAPLLAQIRTQLLPALSQLLTNLNGSLGPALVAAATALLQLFTTLTSSGSGGITAFVTTITALVNGMNRLIQTVPGAGTALTAFFVAAGSAKALLGVVGLVGGAGKAIFDVGKQSFAAAKGTLGFARGLAGITGEAGSALGAAQKVGLALRVNFGLAAQAAVSGMATLVGSVASTSVKIFEVVKAIRLATVATALWTAAQWLLDIALDANPIGLVILSTAALVTGIILLVKYWRQVVDFFLHSKIAVAVVAVAFGALGVAVLLLIRHWRSVVDFFAASWRAIVSGAEAAVGFFQAAVRVGFGVAAAVVRVTMTAIGAVVKATMFVVSAAVAVAMTIARGAVLAFGTVLPVITAVLRLFRAIFELVFQVIRLIVVSVMLAVYLAIRGTLIAILAVWTPTWGLIQRVAQFAWGVIQSVVTFGMNLIRSVITAGMIVVRAVWAAVWGAIRTVASVALGAVRAAVSAGMGAVRAVVSAVVGAIRGLWQAFWGSTVGRVVSLGISNILAAVQRLAGIIGAAASITGRFARAIADGFVGALRAIVSWAARAVSTVEGLAGRFFNAGVAMVAALINGITRKIEDAANAVGRLASRLASKLPGSPVKEGPLRVLNRGRAGRQIVRMLADGITAETGVLARAAAGMAALFADPIVPAVAGHGLGTPAALVAGLGAAGRGAGSVTDARTRSTNITINAAPDVPTSQQLLRVLSYGEALHA